MAKGMHDGGVLTVGKHYPGGNNPLAIDSHMAESVCFQTEEELLEGYKNEINCSDDFDEFLEYNFRSSDIFKWDDQQKEEVLSRYQEGIIERAKDWADNYDMKYTIEI
jgi:hypothetical protein